VYSTYNLLFLKLPLRKYLNLKNNNYIVCETTLYRWYIYILIFIIINFINIYWNLLLFMTFTNATEAFSYIAYKSIDISIESDITVCYITGYICGPCDTEHGRNETSASRLPRWIPEDPWETLPLPGHVWPASTEFCCTCTPVLTSCKAEKWWIVFTVFQAEKVQRANKDLTR